MFGQTTFEKQSNYLNTSVHYDSQIRSLNEKINIKNNGLDKLNQAAVHIKKAQATIYSETERNSKLMDHQETQIVQRFSEPASIAEQLLALSQIDKARIFEQLRGLLYVDKSISENIKQSIIRDINDDKSFASLLSQYPKIKPLFEKIIKQDESFASTLITYPALEPLFMDYMSTVKNMNDIFSKMTKADACFDNENAHPNPKITALHQHQAKLEKIIDQLERCIVLVPQTSFHHAYIQGLIDINKAALSYPQEFFKNKQSICETRRRIANEQVTNNGLTDKLNETLRILNAEKQDLEKQREEQMIRKQEALLLEANRIHEEQPSEENEINDTTNHDHSKQKKSPTITQNSSSATSSTTLHLAQQLHKAGYEPALVTETRRVLAEMQETIFKNKAKLG